MKIIQLNGWLGRLNGPLREFMKDLKADIVCMQEAFAPNSSPMFQDQYGYIDEVIKAGDFTHYFFSPNWGFQLGDQVLDEGNIILSKYLVSDFQAFHTHGKYHVRGQDKAIPNTRLWQACIATLPNNRRLAVANYQGYLSDAGPIGDDVTIQTMKKVRDGLMNLSKPLIFCGDLNVKPESPALDVFNDLSLINLSKTHGVKTTLSAVHRAPQADQDSVACDYVFASQDIQIKNFKVSGQIISDHKALILDFEI